MLVDQIKARVAQAVKDKDAVARDVLRLALGELQTAEARANKPLGDDDALGVLRKLVKSNEETLALVGDGPQAPGLRHELEVLTALMPKTLDVAALVAALASQTDALKAAKNDGQATGVAMKHLKAAGAAFDGGDVAKAVKQIRG